MAARDRSVAAPAVPRERLRALKLGRRAKRGETAAFEEIYRTHHQELYRYCLAILRDREDAEDALQATMAAALRSLPGDRREIDVRPWLFRVAHNESITLLRKRRAGAEPDIEAIDPAASQDAELATRERLRSLVADLGELPERQRSAIVMRELSGLSYGEIGSALSCSEGGARQAVFEARTALRDREEGREMDCEQIRMAISERDGRRLRNRKLKAHLKGCDGCRGFAASISQRRLDLQALCPPLPAAAAGAILSGLAGGGAAGGGAAAGAAGAAGRRRRRDRSLGRRQGRLAGGRRGARRRGRRHGRADRPPESGRRRQGELRERGSGSGGAGGTARGDGATSQGAAADSASGTGGGQSGSAGGRGDGGTTGGKPDGTEARPAATPRERFEHAANGSGGGQGHTVETPDAPSGPGGSSSTSPGHTGSNPGGGTSTAPGQTGSAGNSATAPGHTGATGGGSASAPGQTGSTPAATGSAGASTSTTNNGNGGLKGMGDDSNGNGSK